MTKATDRELIREYEKIGSVWKVAEIFGMCGQSVHERLKKLKIQLKYKPFSKDEENRLKKEYLKYRDAGRLAALALKMGRTKQFICRQAKEIGLTDPHRPNRINNKSKRDYKGENHPNWKGGVKKNNIALYDTYNNKIDFVDTTRRDPNNKKWLQSKCAYCGKWFNPTLQAIQNRIASLNHYKDTRLYCSDTCKIECPIYRKIKYPAGFKKSSSREVSPELRQMVFERDRWECQRCGAIESLHCHHIKGYTQNKMLANDLDNCITLCKNCHKKVHKTNGCKPNDLRCEAAERYQSK